MSDDCYFKFDMKHCRDDAQQLSLVLCYVWHHHPASFIYLNLSVGNLACSNQNLISPSQMFTHDVINAKLPDCFQISIERTVICHIFTIWKLYQ